MTTAEQQINAWIKLLQQSQLLPEEIKISSSLIDNLQYDDISSLICYLIFNLQEEISLEKRIPYVLSYLNYQVYGLQDIPNFSEFSSRLAYAVDKATREQELLPQFSLVLQQGDSYNQQFPGLPDNQPIDYHVISIDLKSSEIPEHGIAVAVESPAVEVISASAAPGSQAGLEMKQYSVAPPCSTVQSASTIQYELIYELQNLNYENIRLQEQVRLFEYLQEYLRLKFQMEILADGELNFGALDDLGARIQVNEAEIEVDLSKMQNPNYLALIYEQLVLLLDSSPFALEVASMATPSSVQHVRQPVSPKQDAAALFYAYQGDLAYLQAYEEFYMRHSDEVLTTYQYVTRASSNMARQRKDEDSDDFEVLQQRDGTGSDFMRYLIEKIDRIAECSGLSGALQRGREDQLEDAILAQVDRILAQLQRKSVTKQPVPASVTPKNIYTDSISFKTTEESGHLTRASASQEQKNQTAVLYSQLAKAKTVIQENVKMRIELENEIQALQMQLEGAQKRCRASQMAYESERLASKRVKTVDRYGIDRLNQELADVRKLALLKGLKK